MRSSRYLFVVAVFCVAACLGSPPARAQSVPGPDQHVRLKWQDFVSGPDGAKRLASLQKAVAKMKQLDGSPRDSADFRRSWTYWANIHGYLGPDSTHFGTVASQSDRLKKMGLDQFLPYLVGTATKPGFTDQTPPDAIAKTVWATCQHSPPGQQLNFFGWHRMYLYYFERVLRWAADDQTLTLPYWDYTDPAQTGLPVAFQEPNPGDPVSPLYDWRRSEALNEGLSTLNPDITNIDGPLTTDTNFLQFEGDIERGVHGNVHCSVGQTCPIAVMGLVGVSANDPIFYEHHANIDRMWSCWQHSHPSEQPGDWQNQQFTFVDETGAPVTRPVKDFLDTRALGYTYDNDSQCARTSAPIVAAAQGVQASTPEKAYPTILSTTKSTSLRPTTTSVDVAVPTAKMKNLQATSPQRTVLVLRNVSSISAPGALVNVYVARKGDPGKRQYVATINWFGVFDHAGDMPGMSKDMPVARTFQYDVTRQLQALPLQATGGLTVTFEAASGLVPSPTKKATANVLHAAPPATLRPDAKLTVGAIELRQ